MNNKIFSLIKYEGDNETFVWKHPEEDFNIGSQLIVHESQEAIFFRDGEALDLFGPGRHTLTAQNLPILGKHYKIPTGGESPFHAEIYFINQTTQMGIKWGTDSKVRMFDPSTGMHIELGASGTFNLRVNDSRKLLVKIVGTTRGLDQKDIIGIGSDPTKTAITGKFKSLVITKVKSMLAKTIKQEQINVLEIDEHLDTISNVLKDEINKGFDEYGFIASEFYVQNIVTPDDDPNFRRLKEQYAEQFLRVRQEEILKAEAIAAQERKLVESTTLAKQQIIGSQADAESHILKAQAEAKEMELKGYTYQQETQRIVASKAADNTSGGVGGIGKDLVGLGVGLGVMGEVIGAVKGSTGPLVKESVSIGSETVNKTEPNIACPSCNHENIPGSKFCSECGTKLETKLKCSNCGVELKVNSKFCPECGHKVGE